MSVPVTYFVHGTTTDNENKLSTGWRPGELSGAGKKQARALGEIIKNKKFDAVFCSDLKRAVDSAQLVFGDKYQITLDSRLRECNYGDLAGLPNTLQDHLGEYVFHPFPNGESYHDVEKRVADFIKFLKINYSGRHIAVMAHQGPQLAFEVLCNKKTWPEAIAADWRKVGRWQAGWEYVVE